MFLLLNFWILDFHVNFLHAAGARPFDGKVDFRRKDFQEKRETYQRKLNLFAGAHFTEFHVLYSTYRSRFFAPSFRGKFRGFSP
jgi:hypothetical protein